MEVLLDFLLSFGLGVSFVLGAFSVVIMASKYIQKSKIDLDKKITEQNEMVEKRLDLYVENTDRIASTLEYIKDYGIPKN